MTMVVTNLNMYCVYVCETAVWEFRLYLFFHWVLQVLQVLTGFLTGETGLGGRLFNPGAESELNLEVASSCGSALGSGPHCIGVRVCAL